VNILSSKNAKYLRSVLWIDVSVNAWIVSCACELW